MRHTRSWFAHLLAATGVVIWLEDIWPDLLPSYVRFFALALFGGLLFLTLRAAIEEALSRRVLKRHLNADKGVTLSNAEGFEVGRSAGKDRRESP
jgi:hypothetical protein